MLYEVITQLTETGTRDFVGALACHNRLILYLVDHVLYGHARHRALFQGPFNAVLELFTVERLSAAVPLDDHKGFFLDALVAGKTVAAGYALPSPPDAVTIREGSVITSYSIHYTKLYELC